MHRVVITGAGAVSSLGADLSSNFKSLSEGKSGISKIEFLNSDRLSIKIGGQIKNYNPDIHFTKQEKSIYDKFTQFALIATKQAVLSSGWEFQKNDNSDIGVILGTAGGGLQTQDENYRQVYEEGKNRVHPLIVPKLMNNAAASNVSIKFNVQGPSFTIASACSSSNHAMGQAFNLIRSGVIKAAITGGSESMLCFGGIKAWEGLRIMSKEACRPFCKNRDGMVQGEGAAIFIFENYHDAKKRGANILAEVAGFSMTSDAIDIVNPSKKGAARAMIGALKDAKFNPEDVEYINAHGTGTLANDKTECAAIKEVFKSHANKLMISSTKSMHGHLIGGTGAVELLGCLLALNKQIIAPTINFIKKDPDCDLDIVPNIARQKKVKCVISNSFAFGGTNAVIALKKCP